MANSIFVTPFGGAVGGSILPSTTDAFDLGSSSQEWLNVYAQTFFASNRYTLAGSGDLFWTARTKIASPSDGSLAISNNGGTTTATLTIPTGTGNAIPVVVAKGRSTAQTAAVASVSTFTVGAADGSFVVSANVLVTTSTTHNFTVTCAYTDEGNTARTLTLGFTQLSGATLITAITNVTGAGPYESPVYHLRCKAATTITFATTGTFTTVTYNVEGIITQVA